MFKKGSVLLLLLLLPSSVPAATEYFEAVRDTTLIEDPGGVLANGAGPYFFVGRTNQEGRAIRRGLIRFDVASLLPFDAVIESVSLALYQSQGNPAKCEVALFRVQDDWGEGASAASGGGGAPAEPGDATWIHTFFDSAFWVQDGGHFIGRESARLEVEGNGYYEWSSTNHLVQDVRLWLNNPEHNFGWILVGDEATLQNAKRFASRENANSRLRPLLEVTYRLPGEQTAEEAFGPQ